MSSVDEKVNYDCCYCGKEVYIDLRSPPAGFCTDGHLLHSHCKPTANCGLKTNQQKHAYQDNTCCVCGKPPLIGNEYPFYHAYIESCASNDDHFIHTSCRDSISCNKIAHK